MLIIESDYHHYNNPYSCRWESRPCHRSRVCGVVVALRTKTETFEHFILEWEAPLKKTKQKEKVETCLRGQLRRVRTRN